MTENNDLLAALHQPQQEHPGDVTNYATPVTEIYNPEAIVGELNSALKSNPDIQKQFDAALVKIYDQLDPNVQEQTRKIFMNSKDGGSAGPNTIALNVDLPKRIADSDLSDELKNRLLAKVGALAKSYRNNQG